jgi:predicted NBD/HSP70 family sugar kinase
MFNILNPSLIFIGGRIAAAGDMLMASVRKVVSDRLLPLTTRDLWIQQPVLGQRAGVVGLTTMVLDELIAPDRITRRFAAQRTGGCRVLSAWWHHCVLAA